MRPGIRDCCIASTATPDSECCGNYDGVPGPIAGDKTKFGPESYTLGCPVKSLDASTLQLFRMWALCNGDTLALFGGSLLHADNRTVDALQILDAEATKIRQANKAS